MDQNQPMPGAQTPPPPPQPAPPPPAQGQPGTPPPPPPPKKSNTGLIVTIIVIVVVVIVGIILAIFFGVRYLTQRATEQIVETQTGQEFQIDEEQGGIKIQTDEGAAEFGLGAELPADFPTDAPIYPNAQAISSFGIGGRYSVSFESSDDYEAILGFYEAQVPANGWSIDSSSEFTSDTGRSTVLSSTKDSRTLIVSVTEDTSSNMVGFQLTITPNE